MRTKHKAKTVHTLPSVVRLALALFIVALALVCHPVRTEPLVHRPFLPGFGGLCDGGPLPCTAIDELGFNARIDAVVLTSTDQRGLGLVSPYGLSVGLLQRLEAGVYSHSALWAATAGLRPSLTMQGPVRIATKALLWPWEAEPHQHFTVLLDFEYEARLPHFDGANQLGLQTDLQVLRAVARQPLGTVELSISAGILFDAHRHYGTPELGLHVGWHLPFLPDVKVFAEGVARGFGASFDSRSPIPGALDPARPILPSGVLSLGVVSRQQRAVDLALVVTTGFGDAAPFALTLRFADIAWGKGYPRPRSLIVEATQELATWVHEQVASVDPKFNDHCDMIDDPPPFGTGKSLHLGGHRTQDAQYCVWQGLWLQKSELGQPIRYWKNRRGTLLCRDEARKHCFARRESPEEPWEPLERAKHTAVLRDDCSFEDTQTQKRLSHFGTRSRDGHTCSDGTSTFRIGERSAYHPALRQIDRGLQGSGRQHPPLSYASEPTTLQRLHTALGRGIELGNAQAQEQADADNAAASAADTKLTGAQKALAEMTPVSLASGVEAAAREAGRALQHAGADPKATFRQALSRIEGELSSGIGAAKASIAHTVQAVQVGTKEAQDWTHKPAVEQLEDAFKLAGRKAITAPREMTIDVATGIGIGATGKLAGELLSGAVKEEKSVKRLIQAADKEANASTKADQLARTGRGRNHLAPNVQAEGPHSTFRRGQSGDIAHHGEWKQNPQNPHGWDEVKRVDIEGVGHTNSATQQKVDVPHTHDRSVPGAIRAARPDELPAKLRR